jgi:hypothetical protein
MVEPRSESVNNSTASDRAAMEVLAEAISLSVNRLRTWWDMLDEMQHANTVTHDVLEVHMHSALQFITEAQEDLDQLLHRLIDARLGDAGKALVNIGKRKAVRQ